MLATFIHRADRATAEVVSALSSLSYLLQSDGLSLAADETIVVATTTAAAEDAASRLGRFGGAWAWTTRSHGMSYNLAGSRSHAVLRARWPLSVGRSLGFLMSDGFQACVDGRPASSRPLKPALRSARR